LSELRNELRAFDKRDVDIVLVDIVPCAA